MRTGKGDAPGMGFPTARRRRELYTAAAFGGQKMASHQRGLGARTPRGRAFSDSGSVMQNSLLLLLKVLPRSCPLSDLLFCSSSSPSGSLF